VNRKETAMSEEQSAIHDDPTEPTEAEAQNSAYARDHEEDLDEQRGDWPQPPTQPELPRRPRRRLMGVGANRAALGLIGVLLTACGFIGGVLVEKGQSSTSGLASRFAALRSAASGAATAHTGAGGFLGGGGGGASGAAGATFGQVAYVSGSTLYVANAEGNTVKVLTSAASTVTKTVKSDVKGIHPGETVIVAGSPGANGSVSAETIRVSEAGGGGGGLGALLGGGGFGAARGAGSEGASRGAGGGAPGGEQALFGK
jgi:hypothetical protein